VNQVRSDLANGWAGEQCEMSEPTFTILMSVVRPPVLMPFAIQSVLNQTRQDFELFIVCDERFRGNSGRRP
jgi:hypothetical protein